MKSGRLSGGCGAALEALCGESLDGISPEEANAAFRRGGDGQLAPPAHQANRGGGDVEHPCGIGSA